MRRLACLVLIIFTAQQLAQRWTCGIVELMPITRLHIKSSKAPQQRALLAMASQSSGVVTYTPTGYTIHSEDFSRFFAQAHANRAVTGISISPGTYWVTASAENSFHIYMRCADSRTTFFELHFSGVFFYFTDYRQSGMALVNCTSVDLHGPYQQTWTNDQLGFTQGTITGVDSKKLVYTVKVDDEYPSERVLMREDIATILFHNSSLLVKTPAPQTDIVCGGTDGRKKLGPNTYSFEARFPTANVTIGDLFVARGNSSTTALTFDKCSSCTARDFAIYSSGGFGMYQAFGQNNTFMNIHVRPYPFPLGKDGKLPLLSSVADIFHSTSAHTGTVVKNNYFVNSGDDAIAMHGFYYLVADVDWQRKAVTLATNRQFAFVVGDLLTFYADSTAHLGTAPIASMESVNNPLPPGTLSSQMTSLSYDDADYIKVRLTSWPADLKDLRWDNLVTSPSNNGNDFAIINNTIGNLRGRGALVKSSAGVIAGNRFFNLKGFAIQLAPENAMESDFVHDILVKDNTINSYGAGVWLGQDPMNWGAGASGFTNNYNVRFVNNTIANSVTTPFLLTSAANVSVLNTTFTNVLCRGDGEDVPVFDWQVKDALMMIANVEGITLSGNRARKDARCAHAWGNYEHPVALVNATDVSGLRAAP